MAFIYSFVARGIVILAEHSELDGNLSDIASECLQKLPSKDGKYTYSSDAHTFNHLVHDGFTYCVVAAESVGHQLPMACMERIKEDFTNRYGGGKAATAAPKSLSKDFGPKLKEHMQYCVDHPEEVSKLANVKAQISQVKEAMKENIVKVIDRQEKIDVLVDKTDVLQNEAKFFKKQGHQIRWKMWLHNMKMKLIVLAIVVILILIIILSVCDGFNCGR